MKARKISLFILSSLTLFSLIFLAKEGKKEGDRKSKILPGDGGEKSQYLTKSSLERKDRERAKDILGTPKKEKRDSKKEEEQKRNDEEIGQTLREDGNHLNRLMLLAFHQRGKTFKDEILKGGDQLKTLRDRDGAGLIHWAVMGSCLECVQVLLQRGFSVDMANKRGETPLVFSSSSGEVELTKMLLEAGANPNIQFNKVHYSLLMDASSEGQEDIVKLLIDHGALVGQVDMKGSTALHYAAKEGHTKVVQILLKNKVDIKIRDKEGLRAKDYALKYGFSDISSLL